MSKRRTTQGTRLVPMRGGTGDTPTDENTLRVDEGAVISHLQARIARSEAEHALEMAMKDAAIGQLTAMNRELVETLRTFTEAEGSGNDSKKEGESTHA